jgi:DeoR/GlpR family transcriptional regulator of sugar metabolism
MPQTRDATRYGPNPLARPFGDAALEKIAPMMKTQAIIRNSRRVFLLADHSKFGRPALVKVGHISEVSALYTDAPPPDRIAAILEESGAVLEISS